MERDLSDNELIAEFMEYKLKQGKQLAQHISGGHEWYWVGENFTIDEPSWLPESNWNLLMPVVERIFLLADVKDVEIHPGMTIIHLYNFSIKSPGHCDNDSITECYVAVIKFIKWYNQNRKQ